MEQTKFNGRTLVFMLFILCCLAGCKTTRKAETSKFPESTRYLSSKVRLTVPTKDAVFTVNGTMKLISGERMQLSFLMPIIRTEVARMEVTPEEILLVDRMGKRYVRATRKELGIPSLEKGRIELSGFSNNSFSLTPTELSSKYTQVELNEILEMLMSL